MISIPRQRVNIEYSPVRSCTVSSPPLYRSNPDLRNAFSNKKFNYICLHYIYEYNIYLILQIIIIPFKRTLSPSSVKNSLNCGVCSVFPKMCSSVY